MKPRYISEFLTNEEKQAKKWYTHYLEWTVITDET